MYATIWGAAVTLYLVNPFHYYPLTPKTLHLVWASFVAFVCGCLLVGPIRRGTVPARKDWLPRYLPTLRILIGALAALGLLGTLVHLYITVTTFGISTFLNDPMRIREFYLGTSDEGSVWWQTLHWAVYTFSWGCNYAALVLGAVYIVFFKKSFLVAYVPIATALLSDFLCMHRSETLNFVCIILFALALRRLSLSTGREHRRPAKRRLIAVWLLIILGAVSFIRTAFVLGKFRAGETPSGRIAGEVYVKHIFNYYCGGLGTFNVVVNRPQGKLWGGRLSLWGLRDTLNMVSYTLLRLVPFGRGADFLNDEYQGDWIQIADGVQMNAFHTYLRYFYDDFGVVGIAFCPFLFGVIATYLYKKALLTRRLLPFVLLFPMLNAVAWSTMVWQFVNSFIWVGSGLLFVVSVVAEGVVFRAAAVGPGLLGARRRAAFSGRQRGCQQAGQPKVEARTRAEGPLSRRSGNLSVRSSQRRTGAWLY
jgi:oligosaccharide repeat unit polymerase